VTGVVPGTDALAHLASSRGSDPAIVVDGGDDLTFADWEQRSGVAARCLVGRGVGSGDRVALRFDARQWADFAVAYTGVRKAGAVAVLVPAGLATRDAARVVRHSGASALVGPPHLTSGLSPSAWVAEPGQLGEVPGGARGQDELGFDLTPTPADPMALAELIYPLAPLAWPRPLARTHGDLVAPADLAGPGWLVHTWAPGSLAGLHVIAHLLAGGGTTAATLARFSPDALYGLVRRLGATTCGLTPGLAAAVSATPPDPPDLDSVSAVVLSPAGLGPDLRSRIASCFAGARVLDVDAPVDPESGDAPAGRAGASQVGMLWHEQFAAGSFNLPSFVRRYRGRLDVGALEQALAEIVRRHEPLRTTFELVEGVPLQVVGESRVLAMPLVDLSDLAPYERDTEAARMIDEATSRPFDLVDGPLFAPGLVRLGPDDHVLIVRLHHTVFDDWSVDVFRREMTTLYSSFQAGEASSRPDPAIRFVDVCTQQKARLDGEVGNEQRAYWQAQMAGAPLAAQLPLGDRDQTGPDRPGAGEPLRHDLPVDLARQVRALAPRLRATPFMTVLAAFELLLARRIGQDDLVIASVVAARGATAIEPMIGCFTKKVLLRLRLDGDPTFPELVARTRTTVLGALAHQDLPFEAVVQQTLGPAAAAHGVVAQVPIVFQGETPQQARLVLPGLDVGPFEVPASARRERHFSGGDRGAGPVWGDGAYLGTFLILSLVESDGGLALVARGVFHRPAAQRLLEDLERLLAEIASSPGRRLSELVLPDPAPADQDGDISLRGLHLNGPRLEAALSTCPGVADVAVAAVDTDDGPRLVAYVVADASTPPTLAQLRGHLWTALPGSPWPAEAIVVDRLGRLADGRLVSTTPDASIHPRVDAPDASAGVVTAIWAERRRVPTTLSSSYWQDFSFLGALAEARAAGLPVTDEQVARCRTPEMLGADLAASTARHELARPAHEPTHHPSPPGTSDAPRV